jgi:preprotein translocase subunit SecG
MALILIILIVLASVILGFIVLVQNPKGGGLAGNVAGFSNQFMGVKQTTDVLEKGTWLFAGIIGALSLFSAFFISGKASSGSTPNVTNEIGKPAPVPSQQPANNTIQLPTGIPSDSTKK